MSHHIYYVSIYGLDDDIKQLASYFKSNHVVELPYGKMNTSLCTVLSEYVDGYGHLIIMEQEDNKSVFKTVVHDTFRFRLPFYLKEPMLRIVDGNESKKEFTEEAQRALYTRIKEETDIPCIYEWMPYLMNELRGKIYVVSDYIGYRNEKTQIYCYILSATFNDIVRIISTGIRIGKISIHAEKSGCSEEINNVQGLDDYINYFSKELAEKVQNSFVPLFDPSKEQYDPKVLNFDMSSLYRSDIKLFNAQKAIITASARNLRTNRSSIICGDMGTGQR
jgi:hypothetical protein